MSWQVGLYATAVLIPLAAFAVEAIFIRQLKRLNAYIATGAIAFSCLLSLIGFLELHMGERLFLPSHRITRRRSGARRRRRRSARCRPTGRRRATTSRSSGRRASTGSSWAGLPLPARPAGRRTVPDLVVPLGVAIDNLSVIMFLMVTFIATLIHIYSMGYMHDDPRYPRFFAYLSLFCFSMLGLVASSNVFMIFIFWELVGVCSYLLIGFWYEEKSNCDAANKAFIVNRVGDVGMLMGLGLLWTQPGNVQLPGDQPGAAQPVGKLERRSRTGAAGKKSSSSARSGDAIRSPKTRSRASLARFRTGC